MNEQKIHYDKMPKYKWQKKHTLEKKRHNCAYHWCPWKKIKLFKVRQQQFASKIQFKHRPQGKMRYETKCQYNPVIRILQMQRRQLYHQIYVGFTFNLALIWSFDFNALDRKQHGKVIPPIHIHSHNIFIRRKSVCAGVKVCREIVDLIHTTVNIY